GPGDGTDLSRQRRRTPGAQFAVDRSHTRAVLRRTRMALRLERGAMTRLIYPQRSPNNSRSVSYADPRSSDLVIHHMPGHFIRRLQQVAVKLFFARVGLATTPGKVAALPPA